MHNIKIRMGFFLILSILLINAITQVQSSVQLGIKDGDSFEFVLDDFTTTDPDSEGYYIGYDYEQAGDYYLQKGDKFTITFSNATPYPYSYDDTIENIEYLLDYEITLSDGSTFSNTEYLGKEGLGGGQYVTSTDWAAQKTEFESIIDELENNDDPEFDYTTFDLTIVDTSSEFGWTGGYTLVSPSANISVDVDVRFEKSNGVLGYGKTSFSFAYNYSDSEYYNNTDYDYYPISFTELMSLKRVGYSPGGDDGDLLADLPGFGLIGVLSAFSLMFIPIILKRKNN